MIDNDGVDLAMSCRGDGPDLLFVHGLGSAQVLWDPFIDTLADRYRCWNLDLRGHGASGRAPGAYRLSDYVSDVCAALDQIGRPTVGIGHSLGGMALVGAATSGRPEVRGLYILDSPLLRPPGESSSSSSIFERQLAMIREFQPARRPVDDYEAILAEAPNPVGGSNRATMVPSQLRGRAASLSQVDPECIEVVLRSEMLDASLDPSVTVPFRVIAADPTLGASFTPDQGEGLRRLNSHVEIETIVGVGHQLFMMRAFDEVILRDVERWLERTGE